MSKMGLFLVIKRQQTVGYLLQKYDIVDMTC